jgi:hypothetical protein
MRTKATFFVGFTAGYVLGARAGRARYEQIHDAARAFMASPAVQSTTSSIQHQAGEALTTAKDKAADKISDRLGDKAPSWLGSGQEHSTNGAGGPNGHQA